MTRRYMLKIFLAVVISISLLLPGIAVAGKVQIPEGKEVKIIFDPTMELNSNNLVEGIPLLVNLYESIEIGGVIIVEKGASGTAVVEKVEKSGRGGKAGYVKITFVDLTPKGEFQAPEGEKIKLAGFVENKGGGKKLLSWLFIFGLFIKGGGGEIDTGVPYTATVAEPIILEN